jgi:hypothetical protein
LLPSLEKRKNAEYDEGALKMIHHHEKAAEWHKRMDARDPRNENQAGHQHVVYILKDAFVILNDGVEFSQDNLFI